MSLQATDISSRLEVHCSKRKKQQVPGGVPSLHFPPSVTLNSFRPFTYSRTPLSPAAAVTARAPPVCLTNSQTCVMFFKFICAVVTRSLFILISLIGVWRVVWVKDNGLYWFLTILYLPLVVEMILTLRRRSGNDYKWYELPYSNSSKHKYVYNGYCRCNVTGWL